MTSDPLTLNNRRSARWLMILTACLVAVGLVAAGIAVDKTFFVANPWNPLGEYPIQTVSPRRITVHDTANVTGIKCVNARTPVTVHGELSWRSVFPLGTTVLVGRGTATLYPAGYRHVPPDGRPRGKMVIPHGRPLPDAHGCTRFVFENPIPNVVVARSREVCRAQNVPTTWELDGREEPTRMSGPGVARVYRTESITIVCG